MSNILSTSPLDNRHFSADIATKLGDINSAVIIQQLHYWLQKDVGVIIDGIKWIYNSFEAWVKEQFKWLSVWQFRQSMSLLRSREARHCVIARYSQSDPLQSQAMESDELLHSRL